ncbi:MAG: hypothetical protein Q7J32_02790 [Sphingomonadaceae bacterium]|nr:hypothetical protein [Sphingomonadaceae bacterium]
MSHQPPVPDASTSPYPLQPAPLSDELRLAAEPDLAADADDEDADDARFLPGLDVSTRMLGLGAAIGLGAAAALTAFFYARRPVEAPKARQKRKAKRAKARY